MKKYALFGLAFAIIVALFLFVPTKKKQSNSDDMPSSGGLTLKDYQSQFFSKQNDSLRALISQLEEKLAKADDSSSKVLALTEAIRFYGALPNPEISSWYVYQKAELIQNSNSWKLTGDNFYNILREGHYDTLLAADITKHAMTSYERSIELDSNNIDAKLRLGEIYISASPQPMNGVQLLLGIVRKDSTIVDAQLLLARFGLESQQYEKVLQRLRIVLSLQPQNQDALLMRAEAHAQTGKLELAVRDLKLVKALPKTPQPMKDQLDMYIKDLEQKNKH